MSRVVALLAIFVPTLACGYSTGQDAGGQGRTIAVPVFTNATLRRDLERDLTRAVQQEIISRTTYRLTDVSAGPELVMTGKITEISEMMLTQRSGTETRTSAVIMTAVITVENRRTGETVLDKKKITERQPFSPVKGETIRTAEQAAMRNMAERIVYSLSSGW